jgi:anti-sigma B factor antagonist
VLGVINPTLGLVGRSMNLDERTLSRLQLCVYELAVNSIEHGTFETKNPTITLALSSNRTHVTASYKDNANLFLINRHLPVDINRQIKSGKTRGLGIFIMNRLSQEFAYKRMGDWNVTSFKIERMTTASIQNSGRTDMSAFSIKLELCDLDNSIIIQPNGAIDSSTTQNMEEHFNSLIKDHKRYIIVDFSQVTFISSSGIGILLGTVSTLRERGGDLIFMKVPTQIREIFDILNITDYFVNINSVEELSAGIPAK